MAKEKRKKLKYIEKIVWHYDNPDHLIEVGYLTGTYIELIQDEKKFINIDFANDRIHVPSDTIIPLIWLRQFCHTYDDAKRAASKESEEAPF